MEAVEKITKDAAEKEASFKRALLTEYKDLARLKEQVLVFYRNAVDEEERGEHEESLRHIDTEMFLILALVRLKGYDWPEVKA